MALVSQQPLYVLGDSIVTRAFVFLFIKLEGDESISRPRIKRCRAVFDENGRRSWCSGNSGHNSFAVDLAQLLYGSVKFFGCDCSHS